MALALGARDRWFDPSHADCCTDGRGITSVSQRKTSGTVAERQMHPAVHRRLREELQRFESSPFHLARVAEGSGPLIHSGHLPPQVRILPLPFDDGTVAEWHRRWTTTPMTIVRICPASFDTMVTHMWRSRLWV